MFENHKKVSFNIASEASYGYILSGQKFTKNANNENKNYLFPNISQCLKITGKVSFNIASEASYGYILSEQKFIENAINRPFWQIFENLKISAK